MQPNILVIRLSSLGDVVLTLPVYKNLKAHWPGCRITVLVKPAYAAVIEGHPCVDEVIVFRGFWDALGRVRRGGFTHLLDLHATFRSFLLRRFSGIPNAVRYRKDALARRLFVGLRLPSPALTRHTIDRYLESLGAWGVPAPVRDIRIEDYPHGNAVTAQAARGPRRALIVQTAFLGDATLTLPLAREVKKLMPPEGRLSVLARPETAEIFRASGWADETIVDDKRGRHSGLRGLARLARELKAGNFDCAIVPHRSLRSALAVRLAGIPVRIGFSSSAGRFLLTETIPFTWGMHDLERNLGLLAPLRAASTVPLPAGDRFVYLKPHHPRNGDGSIARKLREAAIPNEARPTERYREEVPPPRDVGARLIGIHPGSVWPTKRWPAERFAKLIGRLSREAGARVVLVGGPRDADLASEIIRESGAPALNWCGKTTLAELVELMGRLELFVTNDSGPMHVATASGVPTLAVFGPTTRELGFFPYGPAHRVLEAELECRPCGLHGARACPEGHFLCMRLISVDQVFKTALDMLARRTAAARS